MSSVKKSPQSIQHMCLRAQLFLSKQITPLCCPLSQAKYREITELMVSFPHHPKSTTGGRQFLTSRYISQLLPRHHPHHQRWAAKEVRNKITRRIKTSLSCIRL